MWTGATAAGLSWPWAGWTTGECEDLVSREPGLIMLGASSDHTLVDVQNTVRDIQVGDILEFDLCYATMVYLTHSESVHLVFREETTSE